jgi:hypothetical protein
MTLIAEPWHRRRIMTEAESLRKAIRISINSAKKCLKNARAAQSPGMRADFLKMAKAYRLNIATYRTKLASLS